MSNIRPLPRSLAPLPDESLPGYLLRSAHRLELSPADLIGRLGIRGDDHTNRLAAAMICRLTDADIAVLSAVTRLSHDEVRALMLTSYREVYPPIDEMLQRDANHATQVRSQWVFTTASRYCPQCLLGDGTEIQQRHGGAWKLLWRIPLVFACTTHRRLLNHACPHCGAGVHASDDKRARLIPTPNLAGLHPAQCRARLPRLDDRGPSPTPCGGWLTTAPAPTVDPADLRRLLDLQQKILPCLRRLPDHTPPPDSLTAQDLVVTSWLIMLSWPRGRELFTGLPDLGARLDQHIEAANHRDAEIRRKYPQRTGAHHLWTAPLDAAACATLLSISHETLRYDDPVELRSRITPLADGAFERSALAYSKLRRTPMSTNLARALVRHRNGFTAAGRHEVRQMRVPTRDCRYQPRHVPQLVPAEWCRHHFPDFAGFNMRLLGRVAALKLVDMVAGGSWPAAATQLDIPLGPAGSAVQALQEWATQHEIAPRAFDAGAEALAQRLDDLPTMTDYAQRRRALATWSLPEADWHSLTADLPILPRVATRLRWNEHKRVMSSVIIWTHVTSGEYLYSPIILAHKQAHPKAAPLVRKLSMFITPSNQNGSTLTLFQRLEEYAADLARTIDIQPAD